VDRARDPGIGTGRPAAGTDGPVLWQESRAEGATAPWGSAGVGNPVAPDQRSLVGKPRLAW